MSQPTWPPTPGAAATPAIARYAAPKRPSGILILLVVLLVYVAGVVVVTTVMAPDRPAKPTASASPPPTATPAVRRTGGNEIESGGVTGYWKITSTRWSGRVVTLGVEITVDDGILGYEFYAFDDYSAAVLEPQPGVANALDARGFVSPGQTLKGTLTFRPDEKTALTIVMSDGTTQLSALRVEV
jgi:hypothetical protein